MNTVLRQVCTMVFAALLLIITDKSAAQNNSSPEAELIKKAAKYFDEEDFADAYPLYSQLLSLNPDNSDYNYRFGTCMLFSKSNKEEPINYLELAVKDPNVDKLAYYYLGRAYHLNYRFDDAIKSYEYFEQNAPSSELRKYPVDHLVEMCNNGKTLLKDVHDLDVLVKKELSLSDYFNAYDLSANGGNALIEPDDFKTRLDKKRQLNSVIYLSSDKNEVFYASYGDNDKNGKDIYEVKRLPGGKFSKPTNLGPVINTPYDEDYPFYDAPTHTLYFCSKGHNSMGGYDVFKSVYDESSGTWATPVNMDFPINTPDDDILFIADTLGQTAYFASTRSCPQGMIDIYKIKIQAHAPANVLLKGIAYTDNGKNPAASAITVKNYETGQTVGIYNSSRDDGGYFMSLPNGGQLIYTVETPGHSTQSKPVIIPREEELVTLQQEIGYDSTTGKLIITNHFEAAGTNADYLLALNYIKKKSVMDVNVDTTTPLVSVNSSNNTVSSANNSNPGNNNSLTTNASSAQNNTTASSNKNNSSSSNTNTLTANSGSNPDSSGNISNEQLVQIANEDAQQQQQAAKSAKDDADKTTQYANDKMQEAESLNNEAQQITDSAANITDEQKKNDSLAKAASLRQQASDLTKKAMEAYQIAAQEQTDANTKEKQAEIAANYSSGLDSVTKTRNNKDAIAKLQAEQDSLKKQQQSAPVTEVTPGILIRQKADNTKLDSVEVAHHTDELKQEVTGLQQQSENYINQAQKTDNAQEKVALLEQAKDLSDSKKEKQKEIQTNQKLEQQLHNQYTDQLAQAQYADSTSKALAQAGTSPEVSSTDVASIKEEIKNYTPSPQDSATKNNTINPLNSSANNSEQANATSLNNNAGNTSRSNQNNQVNSVTNPANNNQASSQVASNNTTSNSNPQNTSQSGVNSNTSTQGVNLGNNTSNTSNSNQNATASNTAPQNNNSTNNATQAIQYNNAGGVNTVVPTTNVQYSNPDASVASKNAAQYATDADTLSSQANAARQQAQKAPDREHAGILSRKADSLDRVAEQKRIQSDETLNTAGSSQFIDNKQQLTSWQNALQGNKSDKITTASLLMQDAQFYHDKALTEQQKADSSNESYIKQNYLDNAAKYLSTALLKQQQAKNIYLSINPALSSGTVTASSNTGIQQNNTTTLNTSGNNNPNSSNALNNGQNTAQNNTQNNSTNPLNSSTANSEQANTTTLGANPENANQNNTTNPVENSSNNSATNNTSNQANTTTLGGNPENANQNNATNPVENSSNNNTANNTSNPSNSTNISGTNNSNLAGNNQGTENSANNNTGNTQPNNNNNQQAGTNPNNSNTSTLSATKIDSLLSANNNPGNQNTISGNNGQNNNTSKNDSSQQNVTDSNNSQTANASNPNNANNSANSTNPTQNNNNSNQQNVTDSNNSQTANASNPNNTNNSANTTNPTQNNNNNNQQNVTDSNNSITANASNPNNANNSSNNNNPSANNNNNQQNVTDSNNSITANASNPNNAYNNITNNTNPTANNNSTQQNNTNANNSTQTTNASNPNNANNSSSNNTNPSANNNSNQQNNTNSNNSSLTANVSNPNNTNNGANNTNTETNNTTSANSNTTSNSVTMSESVTEDVFSEQPVSPYSANKPIPINPPLPEGLVFKVQIGAFRNTIPQNLFKGIQPITGEKMATGLTRYTAGIFKEFNGAKNARTQIHGLGFRDAFIVAFYNGKRISIEKAMEMQGGNATNVTASATEPGNNTNNANLGQTQPSDVNAAPSTQVTDVKGLFYSVQIGAFQHPVPADKLYNLSPLFSYTTTNGYIRYNCGIYSNLPNASSAKQQIVSKTPIKDAFVVAYSDGQRIGIAQANSLLSGGGAKISQNPKLDILPNGAATATQAPQENSTVPNNVSAGNTSNPVTTPKDSNAHPADTSSASSNPVKNPAGNVDTASSHVSNTSLTNDTTNKKVTFSVQVGAFSGTIPIDMANKLLQISNQGIKAHKEDNGITTYTVGEYPNYTSADLLKQELVKDGYTESFIVAYYQAKKISLRQAQVLINK